MYLGVGTLLDQLGQEGRVGEKYFKACHQTCYKALWPPQPFSPPPMHGQNSCLAIP